MELIWESTADDNSLIANTTKSQVDSNGSDYVSIPSTRADIPRVEANSEGYCVAQVRHRQRIPHQYSTQGLSGQILSREVNSKVNHSASYRSQDVQTPKMDLQSELNVVKFPGESISLEPATPHFSRGIPSPLGIQADSGRLQSGMLWYQTSIPGLQLYPMSLDGSAPVAGNCIPYAPVLPCENFAATTPSCQPLNSSGLVEMAIGQPHVSTLANHHQLFLWVTSQQAHPLSPWVISQYKICLIMNLCHLLIISIT